MADKVAAIADAFYNLSDSNLKNALMRALGDISEINFGQKRPSQ